MVDVVSWQFAAIETFQIAFCCAFFLDFCLQHWQEEITAFWDESSKYVLVQHVEPSPLQRSSLELKQIQRVFDLVLDMSFAGGNV